MKKLPKLHKAEIIILALTLVCLVFTAGYFTGRTTAGVVTVDKLAGIPSPSAASTEPSASTDIATSTDISTSVDTSASADTSTPTDADTANPVSSVPPPAGVKININTATLSELDSLPGIGPVIAGNIVAYRDRHGGFASVGELLDVDGIGPKKLEALKDYITVG